MPTISELGVELSENKVINSRWKIEGKLGEGSCGAVYKVHDMQNPSMKAALKVEANGEESVNVLKKEANVLKKLQTRPHTVRLVYSGRRETYSYVVMTLLGKSLSELRKQLEGGYMSASTATRIGVHGLYAVKQLHEIGFVHRDIKPANMVTGRVGYQRRIVYLIDYGMARNFAIWEEGKPRVRRCRDNVLLRGTIRFCSPTVHDRQEQGRRDDVWSFLYMLIELHVGLPWPGKPETEVGQKKKDTGDVTLLEKCPKEWLDVMKHIRSLTYEARPNYRLIYDAFLATLTRMKVSFDDPYDWETAEDVQQAKRSVSKSVSTSVKKKKQQNAEMSEVSTAKSVLGLPNPEAFPTTVAVEFDKNDIGC
ncbi:hypothetical protein L596_011482 [Steinernema carpocapsae]|uniref:non-specific serine/threonine protein kinase n=1 Tax=Steinernema carpocapsae TaxID=34508 RepID=A0A4U5NU10_STECR|nr:hypothetical protein L596_011482 [Steinernema carpocapsae]